MTPEEIESDIQENALRMSEKLVSSGYGYVGGLTAAMVIENAIRYGMMLKQREGEEN